MSRQKIGLLLAAAAAYGIYKYSKLTNEQKKSLMDKGKDFLNKNLGSFSDILGKAKATVNENGY